MSDTTSKPSDNSGLCEICNDVQTFRKRQRLYRKPFLAATVWICDDCAAKAANLRFAPVVPARARLRETWFVPEMLVEVPEPAAHVSHFLSLVSAYQPTPERTEELIYALANAQATAHREKRSVVVDQDTVDFFFLVHPNQNISLCARLRTYKLEHKEE